MNVGPQPTPTTDDAPKFTGPNMKEKKREQKFQAKQLMNTILMATNLNCEGNDGLGSSTDEDTEEDTTSGNTGKPKPRRPFRETSNLTSAQQMEDLFQGTLLSEEVSVGRGGCQGHRFKCANGHEFTTSFDKLQKFSQLEQKTKSNAKDLWCIKCHHFYNRCVEKATQNKATVTSQIFDKGHVMIKCEFNHTFGISPHRNPDKVWCFECRRQDKLKELQKSKQEEEAQLKQNIETQSQLFKQVKEPKNHLASEMTKIQTLATQHTMHFMALNPTFNYAQTFIVFKILLTPEELLTQIMRESNKEGLTKSYKQQALLVHPDKNRHPLAKQAFQKLHLVYSQVMN